MLHAYDQRSEIEDGRSAFCLRAQWQMESIDLIDSPAGFGVGVCKRMGGNRKSRSVDGCECDYRRRRLGRLARFHIRRFA